MALFEQKAPGIMLKLRQDFDLSVEEAAAILGNLGHECGGFKLMQEQKPTVAGSRGGYGWAQWTGPRRLGFEEYCRRNGLNPASDKANYAWLFIELKGSERLAISAVKRPGSLYEKVLRFEAMYERAGVKHYASRLQYAQRAMAAYNALPGGASVVLDKPKKPKGDGVGTDIAVGGGASVAVGAGAMAGFTDGWVFHFLVFTAVLGAGTGVFLYVRKNRGRLHLGILQRLENSSGVRAVFYRLLGRFV